MIHWGIIGAGRIAHRFVKGLSYDSDSILEAVSCRTAEKAQRFAQEYQCPKAYGGFENIVNDPDIDAVYVAVPHAFHIEWVIRCMKAGKAVLCEKPMALNAEQVREIMQVQKETGVLCMEAMKTRFVPLYHEITETVRNGTIGELTRIQTSFCYSADLSNDTAYYNQPVGGGALLDVGIYNASWIAELIHEPLEMDWVRAVCRNGIDLYTDAFLHSEHCSAILECGFDRVKEKTMILFGTGGRIKVFDFHRPVKAEVLLDDGRRYSLEKGYEGDDMASEIIHFTSLMKKGKNQSEIMPLSDSLRCAEILDLVAKGYQYDESTLTLLQAEEERLQFDSFDYADAFRLASVIQVLQKEYDRNIALSIFDEESDMEIIRILQDGKTERNLRFIQEKRKCARAYGHSSLYGCVMHELKKDQNEEMRNCMHAGGAFPIRVSGKWKYTVSVSGLHEGKDHELIVRGLSEMLQKQPVLFPYKMV